jgi:shikimate dehydrogenase
VQSTDPPAYGTLSSTPEHEQGMTEYVALLGHPVAHSLSPRMQNAAFAARGLDWLYVAFDVEDVASAIAGLRALGFAGANVTIPHKEAAAAACDEADGEAVNTLVFRGGRVLGFNTDREILRGVRAERAVLIGGGGAAKALRVALPADTRVFTRGGEWPPVAEGADVIVNATPVKDELLVRPQAGQTVVDLAYGDTETALVAAARAAGCDVVDGREALVRQGAASFRHWTGVEPPVEVMRATLRG